MDRTTATILKALEEFRKALQQSADTPKELEKAILSVLQGPTATLHKALTDPNVKRALKASQDFQRFIEEQKASQKAIANFLRQFRKL
jgi:hypothetical protein